VSTVDGRSSDLGFLMCEVSAVRTEGMKKGNWTMWGVVGDEVGFSAFDMRSMMNIRVYGPLRPSHTVTRARIHMYIYI
jgi:hypothetical protein